MPVTGAANAGLLLGLLLAAGASGCGGRDLPGRASVLARLGQDVDGIGPAGPGQTTIPPGVEIEDGVTEGEAVSLALWNHPGFQEALSEMGIRRADVVQAGLLANPVLSVLFPIGSKQLEFAAKLPLEVLLFRPGRVAMAELDLERTAALLTQNGLDLMRDVRRAFAALASSRREAELAGEAVLLREEAARFQEAQLRAGEASELDAAAARLLLEEARREARRASSGVSLAGSHVRGLLGLRAASFELIADPASGLPPSDAPPALAAMALAARPDLRAAELGLEIAGERAGLEKYRFVAFSVGLDANNEDPFELGPTLDLAIPLFDRGQGGRAMGEAEVERAARRLVRRKEEILLEVDEARLLYEMARDDLQTLRSGSLRAQEEILRLSEAAFRAGETSRMPVLDARERLLALRREEARLEAEALAERADLERAIGRRLE